MTDQQKEKNSDDEEVLLRIGYRDPGPGVSANHLLIQRDDHDVTFIFYQVSPPLVIGTDEERRQQLESISEVAAYPVAKIIVSRSRIGTFYKLLNEQLRPISGEAEPNENNEG